MKYVVTKQHYDLKPGLVVNLLGQSDVETTQTGVQHLLVTSEQHPGMLVIPVTKLELLKGNTEVFSPYETINS